MDNLTLFMAENKKTTEHEFYAATKSLCDENGTPLLWEFAPISSEAMMELQKKSAEDNGEFALEMVCASVIKPPLNSASLQDSYGVHTPKQLLLKMVDNSAEFTDLMSFVFEFSGFGSEEELRDRVKNL